MKAITFTLNGSPCTALAEPGTSFRDLLRGEGCFSVRFGSDDGSTGAATVLLDGTPVSADVVLAEQADGHSILTLEGLEGPHGELHPIQQAFMVTGALQSGYSAGAMMMVTKALLDRNPSPSEAEIRDAMGGVLDRETAYVKVVEAVERAGALLRGEPVEPFRPHFLTPLTNGRDPTAYEPFPTAPGISPAVPRVIPSPDVPTMSVVGKPEIKVDALKLVKGHPTFSDDIELRGMLTARVLRSPHAHARILDIDDSEAVALPGVHTVIHYKNTKRIMYASGGQSWPNPLPWDQVSFDNKVRHVGDRVAAVAADNADIAAEALRRIKVTYEVLPFILDERQAMEPGAPVIHDEPDAVGIHEAEKNIVHHILAATVPDNALEAAFASAHKVYEHTFHVHQVQQTPIEPHVTVGWLDEDDRMVFRTATQVPFHARRMVAPLLGLTVKDVRVIKPRIGGGFGAKQEMLLEDIVGHLVLKTRKPVRLVLSHEEEFTSSRSRHPQTITYRTGVDDKGFLVAQEMRMIGNTGPYGTHGFTVQNVSGIRGLTSYNCPAKKFECHVVYTNIPVPGAYRGYGAPQAEFALECHMEDIARDIGMDLLDFKRQNWVKAGDKLDIVMYLGERGTAAGEVDPATYPPVMTSGTEECVAQGIRAIGWHRRNDPTWTNPADRPNIRRGIGFAFCMHGTAIPFLDMGGCSIKMNDDGSFNVLAGAADLGTGADTVLSQIAAEVLGVPLEDIKIYSGDTDMTPFDVGAYASSTTYISGTAVKRAADAVRWRIKLRAARLLGLPEEEACSIELRDRRAWAPDGRSVSLEDIALNSLHTEDHEQIMGTASFVSPDCPPPFGAQFAEIELDVDTGQVTVTRLVMAVDCGVAINPVTASGQIEGGMLQALGYGHCEEFAFDETGRMVNTEFDTYRIYRADEMPTMEVFLVQTMEDSGPFGAKAVAEIPKDGVAPALRSAILNATGVAIDDIPFTPERVLAGPAQRTLMTIITADWVVAEPGETPLRNAAVRVVGSRITAVGPIAELRAAHPSDDLVDGSGCVLAPGFVNTHAHMYGVLAHGIPLDQAPSGFWPFLEDFWWPRVEDALDHDMILAATHWVGGEMLRTGTTTFYDILEAPNALSGILVRQGEVVKTLGLRGILSFEATQRVSRANGQAGIDENLAMIEAGRSDGPAALVNGLMCIHTTFTCPPPFIEQAFALATERDVLFHAHVNEGTHEGILCAERYGKRTLELYDELGVAGSRMMASQCVQLSEREREIIAERHVKVTHMPLSNCEVGGGIAPVPEMLANGVTLGLGSDGYLNDMFAVIRGACLIHKARLCNPQVMPAGQVFRLATTGGAEALGMDDRIGRLAPGYLADLQLIDASFPTPASAHNLYDQLVLWRSGTDVRDVMVNGSWRMRDFAVTDFDTVGARARVGEQAVRLWTKS